MLINRRQFALAPQTRRARSYLSDWRLRALDSRYRARALRCSFVGRGCVGSIWRHRRPLTAECPPYARPRLARRRRIMTLTIGHSDAPKRSGCGLGSMTRFAAFGASSDRSPIARNRRLSEYANYSMDLRSATSGLMSPKTVPLRQPFTSRRVINLGSSAPPHHAQRGWFRCSTPH